VEGDEFVIITPDHDIYVEQMSVLNPDLNSFHPPALGGGLPPGVPPAQVYGFGHLPVRTHAMLMERAAQIGAATRVERGIGAPVLAVAGPVGAEAVPVVPPPVPPAPLAMAVAGHGMVGMGPLGLVGGPGPDPVRAGLAAASVVPMPPPRYSPSGGMWVLDEPTVQLEIGTEIRLPAGFQRVGERALTMLNGDAIAVRFLPEGVEVNAYARERSNFLSLDRRTLPVLDPSTLRPTFAQEITQMRKVDRLPGQVSPLLGAESAPYVLDMIAQTGQSMVSRHSRWRAESGISASLPAVYEHEVISTVVEYAVVYDRLNVKNLVSFELLLRRLQLHESAVAQSPGAPSYEGAQHFLGTPERRGGAIVAPALTQYVAAQLSHEAAIEKEKRKAREARTHPPTSHNRTPKSGPKASGGEKG